MVAIYKGDEVLVVGTVSQCAEALKIKPSIVYFYTTKCYRNRLKKRENEKDSLIGEKVNFENE